MPTQSTLVVEYRQPADPPKVSVIEWPGVVCKRTLLRSDGEFDFRWCGVTHYLAIHDVVLDDGEILVETIGVVRQRDFRDRMTFVPASLEISGWAKPSPRINGFTAMYYDPAALSEELEREILSTDQRPLVNFDDRNLSFTMSKLEAMLAVEGMQKTLYAETLALLAAVEIQRIIEKAQPADASRAHRLSAVQERLVRDYIASNLHREIPLSDLANLAHLSRFHFARSFKATFGEPPHRYLLRQRVERSIGLLKTPGLSLEDIAIACGFGDKAQYGRVFRKQTGMTPSHFRRTTLL